MPMTYCWILIFTALLLWPMEIFTGVYKMKWFVFKIPATESVTQVIFLIFPVVMYFAVAKNKV